MKLHAYAVIAIGVGRCAVADNDRRLGAVNCRFGMYKPAVTVDIEWSPRHADPHGRQPIAIKVGRGFGIAPDLVEQRGPITERRHCIGNVLIEIVACLMGDLDDCEAAMFFFVAGVIFVVVEAEDAARHRSAHGTFTGEQFRARIECLALIVDAAIALGRCLPGVLAGVVDSFDHPRLAAVVDSAGRRLGSGIERAVVPTRRRGDAAVQATAAVPSIEAVFAQRGSGLGETKCRLNIVDERFVVIGNDQGMFAENVAVIAGVFEPTEQSFFDQQATDKRQIGFLVLGSDRAGGVELAVGNFPAPVGYQFGLLPAAQNLFDDVEHRTILIDHTVTTMIEKRQPGFDLQLVTSEPGVGADARDLGDMPMERPKLGT